MRIGIACPYLWDIPGGVQFHIRDLAGELISRGHEVSVITPAEDPSILPDFAVSAGPAVSIPYNGSVARLAFGPRVNHHVRTWVHEGKFDVIHVHEPVIPSVSMMALLAANCPVVATFHAATDRSRALEVAAPMLRPMLEKISSRIAVSAEARRTAIQHLGGDAYIIPNGVFTRSFDVPPVERFTSTPDHPTLAFLGRLDEPRKGLPLVAEAFPTILERFPGARLFVAGRGDIDAARARFGQAAENVTFLGGVSDEEKAQLLASVDVYVAPNTGGESFGIILIEAMSAGAYVLASNIPAFRAVLANGTYGGLFDNEDAASLAQGVIWAWEHPSERADIAAAGKREATRYDWATVASQVLAVYENALAAGSDFDV